MAAISTPGISSIFERIRLDFPDLQFELDSDFRWLAEQQTITYSRLQSLDDLLLLLHEIGHAQLQHDDYSNDSDLLIMERQAWQYAAKELAPRYQLDLSMDHSLVQDSLDGYRYWLDQRSTCPKCTATGIEKLPQHYQCLICQQKWQVNEARTCQLKRYKK